MVKYNKPEFSDFKTFWETYAINPDPTHTIRGNNQLSFTGEGTTIFNYQGYLYLKAYCSGGEFIINNKSYIGEIEFNGIVETLEFKSSISGSVEIFKISSINLSISEISKTFYQNWDEDTEFWGELILDIPSKYKIYGIDWYNPSDNIINNQMALWSYNKVYNTSNNELANYGIAIDADYGGNRSIGQPSGYTKLSINNNIKFPILIHKNDIGKKNTIGPLLQEDGSEIYINLTII